MGDTEQIHVRVSSSTKQEWEDYADEHDLTLTALIKTAVNNHLSDEWVLRSQTADLDLDLSEVTIQLDELDSQISSMSDQIDELSMAHAGVIDDLTHQELLELANRIHNHLPGFDPEARTEKHYEGSMKWADIGVDANTLADDLDESLHHTRTAAIYLENTESAVASQLVDGKRYWYLQEA